MKTVCDILKVLAAIAIPLALAAAIALAWCIRDLKQWRRQDWEERSQANQPYQSGKKAKRPT